MRRALACTGVVAALALGCAARAAPPALEPPSPKVLAEARRIVAAMKENPRGPYRRLRWYCNDGSVLPPKEYACRPHGGGVQHAEYSADRKRLAALGWSVGTIFTALPWREFFDESRRNQRMRELALERYLIETEDGWVLEKALTYRGRVQVEDEETSGRKLLVKLLSRPEWVRENYLLAREMVRVLPHHGGNDRTRETRRLSQELSELRPDFEPIRVLIHTAPGPRDLVRTRKWMEKARADGAFPEALELAARLEAALGVLYGPERDWLGEGLDLLEISSRHRIWASKVRPMGRVRGFRRLELLAGTLASARELVGGSDHGRANLATLDLTVEIERAVLQAALEELGRGPHPRRHLLRIASLLVTAAQGTGFLSPREAISLTVPVQRLLAAREPGMEEYKQVVARLGRSTGWALASLRHAFAEALVRYGALEPASHRFVDDAMRSSPVLPLSETAAALTLDLDRSIGRTDRVLGDEVAGAIGLNAGVGRGTLRWLEPEDLHSDLELPRETIAVLPRTVSNLPPVAGILSLAEGNLLSHVQLLARNLGIPNAYLTPESAEKLRGMAGNPVVLAVGTDGAVVVETADKAEEAVARSPDAPRLEAPLPDLNVRRPIELEDLKADLSGKVVGPKAANLGELARAFPGRVAPAVALPFGFFHTHTSGGPDSPRARLDAAYARHRRGKFDDAQLSRELDAVRGAIAAVTLPDTVQRTLSKLLEERFGPPGTYGVFLRSDTNVEDMPGFTGAGLNKTVPNLTKVGEVLAAIPRIWASVLSPRSRAWRGSMLRRPEEIYSSVVLMKSVASEKSGVLITRDLVGGGEGLTVSTAWGVGGAVDGEAAETIVLHPNGAVELVAESKAPYQRTLDPKGGVHWEPAPSGQVLTEDDMVELRNLAGEIARNRKPEKDEKGRPLPWDVEFGFVDGKLALFQIRPLVERGNSRADQLVSALLSASGTEPTRLALEEKVPVPRRQEEE